MVNFVWSEEIRNKYETQRRDWLYGELLNFTREILFIFSDLYASIFEDNCIYYQAGISDKVQSWSATIKKEKSEGKMEGGFIRCLISS